MENSPIGGGWLWHSVLLANLSQLSTLFLPVQLPVCPGGCGLEVLTAVVSAVLIPVVDFHLWGGLHPCQVLEQLSMDKFLVTLASHLCTMLSQPTGM